jgi:hypothetical protein
MRKLTLLCAGLCAMAFVVPLAPVHAQVLGWVGPTGQDTNSCSQTAPCATFAGVIGKVAGVTQINCLGSGNYGALNSTTVSITGSLVIDCGVGNIGEMTLNGGNQAININSSSAATIVLRHLSLSGNGSGSVIGINTQNFASGTLIIEDCTIQGFGEYGVDFAPSSGRGTLQVTDSLLYNNGFGIVVSPSSGQVASVAFNRDELTANSATALYLIGSGVVAGTMRESLVGENGATGVFAGSSGGVYFTVEESSIIDNLTDGIASNVAAANVSVGASTIGGNGTGVKVFAGSIVSFGNNQMSANGTNGSFTGNTPLE